MRLRVGYGRKLERSRARSRAESLEGRDIGDIPPVQNAGRKADGMGSLRIFLEEYFPLTFEYDWCQPHLDAIATIERACRDGGEFALAMPRGYGKTSICERASIWALVSGLRSFPVVIGAEGGGTLQSMRAIKVELGSNPLLLEDFPEVVYPIHCIEGESRKCLGQLHYGKPTHITWTDEMIALPMIPGSRAGGSVIACAGITGRLRGMKHTRPSGETIRPDIALIDDPQTDESAASAPQVAKRESIINKAIKKLAGPKKKIACVMPCTVIFRDDLADRFLDRKRYPNWQGQRTKMVISFPVNESAWAEYAAVRQRTMEATGSLAAATEYYRKNRAVLDEGAEVSWPELFDDNEASGVQHAMNLRLESEEAFCAECQNEPLDSLPASTINITVEILRTKVNGLPRFVAPFKTSWITTHIDVQKDALYYLTVCTYSQFGGHVLDYGTFPDQGRPYFLARDIKTKLTTATGTKELEPSIYAGLVALAGRLATQEYRRDDGLAMRNAKILIDARWGLSTEVVHLFARQTPHAAIVMPAIGDGIGPSKLPMDRWTLKPTEIGGLNWVIRPATTGKRVVNQVTYDTNYWKSHVAARLILPMGSPGAITVFGSNTTEHRMLFDQLCSEWAQTTSGRDRWVDVWEKRSVGAENHFWDNLVAATMAASMLGAKLPVPIDPEPKRKSLEELYRDRRAM